MHQGFECAEVSGVLLDTTSSPGRCSLLRTWYQLREGVRLAKAENARPLIGYANHFDSMLIHDSELAFLWYSYGRGLEKQGKTAQRRYRKLLVQRLAFQE